MGISPSARGEVLRRVFLFGAQLKNRTSLNSSIPAAQLAGSAGCADGRNEGELFRSNSPFFWAVVLTVPVKISCDKLARGSSVQDAGKSSRRTDTHATPTPHACSCAHVFSLMFTSHYWDAETGENDCFSGKGHSNQVSKMVVDEANELVTCSMDDTLRYTNINKKEYSASDLVKMDFQPKSVSAATGGLSLAVCIGQIVLLKDKKKVFTLDNLDYEAEVGVIHPGGTTAAVGGTDGKIRLYAIQGTTLKDEGKTIEAKGPITDMAYSNDGAYLAAIDEKKVATVYSVADGHSVKQEFYGHHAKPVTLAWSPDNEHFATGGMDMMVYIWTVADADQRIKLPDTHRLHHVSGLVWIDEHTLVTASHDASIKQWTITY
ncbi:WD repeat-containing protein 1 [Lates japonicus]|uniref:WD repeat-containing protein 1 n=1 Tax=Lates japonicus TaxID=270547 RepID=A0AAD3NET6_LATJO|nr:WD repeat-containing protein 1 [Lates japonicus]